jgi:hypothetical protein
MRYATIEDLRSQLGEKPGSSLSPAYVAKMMHVIPEATDVDRVAFLLARAAGKRVAEFGASGTMHEQLLTVAAAVYGVDRTPSAHVVAFDLDDVRQAALPTPLDVDLVICGEVLEHLSNPGWFLQRVRRQYPGVPVLITVPNAFTNVARAHLKQGLENVNIDHCAWYSYITLRTLLGREGYAISEFHWYGGAGPTAQGLVVVAE